MTHTPKRIIDANANRAREALRVLEEAARFMLDDADTVTSLKQARHDLAQAVAQVPGLIHHRDTPGDVGTEITTNSEHTRTGVKDVVNAAGARLSEALRSIEEYAKTLPDPPGRDLARTAERVRYRGYDLTKGIVTALGSGRGVQWRLCLLLTESLCTYHPWQDVLEASLGSGVDCVQVREKDMGDSKQLDHARAVIELVASRASVIVNDRPDLALLAGADGVHLGQTDLSPDEVRKLAGDHLIIGVSTANLDHAKQARDLGADYCGIGPMFATTTKHKPELAGPDYLRDYLNWDGLPHLAIGGINPDNVDRLTSIGCRGVAVSSAICSAKNPGEAAAALCIDSPAQHGH